MPITSPVRRTVYGLKHVAPGEFKYFDAYRTKARPQGHTIVFGLSWTLRIPKPQAAQP